MKNKMLLLGAIFAFSSFFGKAQTNCWNGNGQVSYERWDIPNITPQTNVFYTTCSSTMAGHRISGNFGGTSATVSIVAGSSIVKPSAAASSSGSFSDIGALVGSTSTQGGFTVYQGYIYIPCFAPSRDIQISTSTESAVSLFVANTSTMTSSNFNTAYAKADSLDAEVCSASTTIPGTLTNGWVKYIVVVSDGANSHSFSVKWKATGSGTTFVNIPSTHISSTLTGTSTVTNCNLGCSGSACIPPSTPVISGTSTKICPTTSIIKSELSVSAADCPAPNTKVWYKLNTVTSVYDSLKTKDTINVYDPGSYKVVCKASDVCKSPQSAAFVIEGVPGKVSIITPAQTRACYNIPLVPNLTETTLTYKWYYVKSPADSLISSVRTDSARKTGSYYVVASSSLDPTCSVKSSSLALTLDTKLDLKILSAKDQSCSPIELTAELKNNNTKWYDSKNIFLGAGLAYTVNKTDTYRAEFQLGNCLMTGKKLLKVGGELSMQMELSGDPSKICEPDAVTITSKTTMDVKWYYVKDSSNFFNDQKTVKYLHTDNTEIFARGKSDLCYGRSPNYKIIGIPKPKTLTITPLKSSYCANDAKTVLVGKPDGGKFYFAQNTEKGPIDGVFDPSKFVEGNLTYGYAYLDNSGCVFTAETNTKINPIPAISVVSSQSEVCNNGELVALAAEPKGGVFTSVNKAIVDVFKLDPAKTKPGIEEITYTYQTNAGCIGIKKHNVLIKKTPELKSEIPPILCPANKSFLLSVLPKGGVFTSESISGNPINTAELPEKEYTLKYKYTDPSTTCSNQEEFKFAIKKPDFTFVDTDPVNCKNGSVDIEVKPIIQNAVYTFTAGSTKLNGPKQTVSPVSKTVYTVSQEFPNNEACNISRNIEVKAIECVPLPSIGISKEVSNPAIQFNESFNIKYTITIKNYGNEALRNVSLKEDLKAVFNKPGMSFLVLRPPTLVNDKSELKLNGAFDGKSNIELLAVNSILSLDETNKIEIEVNVITDGESGPFNNTVEGSGVGAKTAKLVTDKSRLGVNPDPTGKLLPNTADNNLPTPVTFPSVNAFFAEVMTPNGDGQNDVYVIKQIGGCTKDLQVYNRWGSLVFSNDNYQNNWDGTYDGGPLPDGIYNAVITLKNCPDSARNIRKSLLFSIIR